MVMNTALYQYKTKIIELVFTFEKETEILRRFSVDAITNSESKIKCLNGMEIRER